MKFKRLLEFSEHLRMIRDQRVPAMKRMILDETGKAVKKEVQEVILGRITPLPPIGRFPGWQPLQPATIEQKEKEGLGKNGDPRSMLYATGDMAESIDYRVLKGNKAVAIGTDNELAKYHEWGTLRIPARPFLGPAVIRAMPRLIPRTERLLHRTIEGKSLGW